jgi:predicted GNAT superfamily acetyltransferase
MVNVAADQPAVRVQVPADLAAVRQDPDAAMLWRLNVRSALQNLLESGYTVTGFAQPESGLPYYVLRRAG